MMRYELLGSSVLDWFSATNVLLFVVVFALCFDFIKHRKPKNFPPGPPWSLPFVGDFLRINFTRMHLDLYEFAKKYGNIFSMNIFGPRAVFLNGTKMLKEAFVQNGENFADRPHFPIFEDAIGDNGVVASNGYAWKQQRRFALYTLKNFGLGKKSLEPSIQQECRCLNEAVGQERGKPFDPHWLVNNAVSNVICALVFGDRFEYSNAEFQSLLRLLNETVYLEASISVQIYNLVPWLMRHVPGPHLQVLTNWNKVVEFIRKKVEEHREDYDPSTARDYIDCFLAEMEKWQDDPAAGFNIKNLCVCTMDLFVAGTETTSSTLYWGLLYMINFPEIQKQVQEEIDRVVGSSRQPTVEDREKMPYTNAVIHETQRFGNIIPINVPRLSTKDTHVGGYIIPKGTMVFGSLTSVLFDETEWETPHSFNPAHFLDADGKFRRREAFLPFSIGKRVCLGEQLARMELFLFFTSLLQRFSFSPPEGEEPSLEFRLGATLCPKPYKLCAVPR
ncbi:cytochrome P450 2J2-like [Denticeps clupeoides]|uniref:cytochrome P450 2J2-like n=1 Tax=Denticeps clupeoides TaxID=299321 RepID=UPI0010A44C32|nr:cytochrome P450 2J2-like [Denticeps clupeoides]